MAKKLSTILIALICIATMASAQTLMLEPHGVTPANVKADTVGDPHYVGLFDRPFSGLANVGVETQMYLKGSLPGGRLSNPTFTVTEFPTGSVAAVGVPVDIDSSAQIAVFTPDLEGTYVVEFTDGEETATLTINAAKYLGVQDGGCRFCHSEQTSEWEATGHADMFQRGLDGMIGSYYGENCIECHTVGYDTFAVNDGFDDFDFVFPDSLFVGQYDNMVAAYPAAMKRGNIQCESCHGPASAHNGLVGDARIVSSLSSASCGVCHDDDHYHVYPSQWRVAGHSNLPPYPAGNRTDCQGCHNGAQFIQFVKGQTITRQPAVDITCAVCHDPHDATNPDQLRAMNATLANGQTLTEGGKGLLCMNCHQSRRDAKTYTNSAKPHYGPHYAPQADMLLGTNAVTFGKTLPSSPHLAALEDACVDCHMYEAGAYGEHDEAGNLTTAGMHSFSMVSKDGVDNVAACEDCHGNVGETFDEKKFYVNGDADLDGDGTEEGLQEEVHGLMDELGSLLPSDDPHADVDSTWTLTELKATFNHRLVYYDHSYGIHNPAFTVALLKVTIQALKNNAIEGEIVAIQDVPNDQGKQVWIIWDKFVDDGLAVDPVEKYIVKRQDGDVWVGVGEYTAHGVPRYALVVPTLFDSTDAGMAMTTFKVAAVTRGGMVTESVAAQGYSVDNLIPHAPGNLMAMAAGGDVELTWEAPADPDVKYYKIYRADQADFVADETTEIGNTAELNFMDVQPGVGTWYYKVLAVDFSGNLGQLTPAVNATLTSVSQDDIVPNEYDLGQNYPNPFNPETLIAFSLKNPGRVTLEIYNARGQKVSTLVDKNMSSGKYSINFIADGLSSGVYLYRLKVSSSDGNGVQFQSMKKMILMK